MLKPKMFGMLKWSPGSFQSGILAVVIGCTIFPAHAQTYVGNLDGSSVDSTFEGASSGALPASGWTALSGSPWIDASSNAVIHNTTGVWNPYGVQYITGDTLVANSTYTLSFRMGYFGNTGTGFVNYSFELGTWDGSTFTSLQSTSGGPVPYNGNFGQVGSASITESFDFTTGGSVSTDFVAIQWNQTNNSYNSSPYGSEYFSFDNATLSYLAVPEPSIHAVIFGLVALGFVVWHGKHRVAA